MESTWKEWVGSYDEYNDCIDEKWDEEIPGSDPPETWGERDADAQELCGGSWGAGEYFGATLWVAGTAFSIATGGAGTVVVYAVGRVFILASGAALVYDAADTILEAAEYDECMDKKRGSDFEDRFSKYSRSCEDLLPHQEVKFGRSWAKYHINMCKDADQKEGGALSDPTPL